MFLNNQYITEEIKKEIRTYPETNDNKKMMIQKSMRCSKSRSKREAYNNANLLQEPIKISNKQPNLCIKQLEKEAVTKPKVSRRNGIINIKSEINKIK